MFKLYFDAGLREHGFVWAFIIYHDKVIINKQRGYIKDKSVDSNAAEFYALIYGLREAILKGITELQVYGDSQQVIYQVNNLVSTNKKMMLQCKKEVRDLSNKFDVVSFNWVESKDNKVAHRETR